MATTLDVSEMLPTKSGVYRIRNKQNGRVYIGSSINLPRREREHFQLLKRNSHTNHFLQNDFNKETNPDFVFEILKTCKSTDVLSEEQTILDQVFDNQKNCYNLSPKAVARYGKHTISTKQKISSALKGKPKTEQHVQKMISDKAKVSKSVYQISLSGTLIKRHRSISNASKNSGIAKASITSVLNEKRYQAGGFLWVSDIEKVCFAKRRYLKNREKESKRKSKEFSLNNPQRKYHGDHT